MKERRFVEAKVSELGEAEVLRRWNGFRSVCRFIDDRASAGINPKDLPGSDDYGLELVPTGSGRRVVFLGIETTLEEHNGRFVTFAARDKQHAFAFQLIRFPSWTTCLPRAVTIGTMIGMLTRTLILTSKVTRFIDECKFLLNEFKKRGYPDGVIRTAVHRFAHRRLELDGRRQVVASILSELDRVGPNERQDTSAPAPPVESGRAEVQHPHRDPAPAASNPIPDEPHRNGASEPEQRPWGRIRGTLRFRLPPRASRVACGVPAPAIEKALHGIREELAASVQHQATNQPTPPPAINLAPVVNVDARSAPHVEFRPQLEFQPQLNPQFHVQPQLACTVTPQIECRPTLQVYPQIECNPTLQVHPQIECTVTPPQIESYPRQQVHPQSE